jgi:hypothetical protein
MQRLQIPKNTEATCDESHFQELIGARAARGSDNTERHCDEWCFLDTLEFPTV